MLDNDLRNKIGSSTLDIKMEYLKEVFYPIIKELWHEIVIEENKAKPLMTIEDIARKFKVTKATVHNWRNRGLIVGVKVGKNRYFTEEEVKAALTKYGFTKQWD